MTPLFLTVAAFGPFAEKQSLNFQGLAHTPLFLIHGPTGAGKSSLLDAMCFALYGETSGGEKDLKFIRSDFSNPSEETFVRFDFALGGKTYRIHRSPEQERPKKRGEGTTRSLARATLWECRGDTQTVMADRWAKVTDDVIRLTGFDVSQFRQVVVLPQGQFRKFLLANSTDRQAILESLFRTERYRIIETALKDAAKDIKDDYDDVKRKHELILESEQALNRDDLDAQISDMTARISRQADTLTGLEDLETKARHALDLGKTQLTLLTEEGKAATAYSEILSRQEATDRMKTELARAQKAKSLIDAEAIVSERKGEYDDLKTKHAKAQKDAAAAQEAKNRAEAAYALEVKRQGDVSQKQKELSDLTRLSLQLDAFLQAEKNHANAEKAVNTETQARDRKKMDLDSLRNRIREKTDQIRLAGEAASQVDGLALAHDRLKKNGERLEALHKIKALADAAEKDKQAAQERLNQFEQSLARDKEAFEQLESMFHAGQAARLAQGLIPGKPCPVCGSTRHPKKAQSDSALLDENTLKKARADVKQKEADHASLRDKAAKANEARVKQVSQRQAMEEELGDLAGEQPATLKLECNKAQNLLEQAQNQQRLLPQMKEALDALTAKEAEAVLALDQATRSLDTALQERARHLAVLDERKASIPEELRDPARMASRLKELDTFIRKAEQAREKAGKDREACLNQATATSQAIIHTSEALAQATSVWTKAADDFGIRLQTAGFSSHEDFKQALRSDADLTTMETSLTKFGEDKKAAGDRLDRARKAAENLVMPDMQDLESRLASVTSQLNESRKEKTRLETLLARKLKVVSDLKTLAKQSAELEAKYAVSGKIAEVAGGRGLNSSGMTFQRYVLAALFDDVLYTAGQHLKAMSRNRFDLMREQDRLDKRSAAGLDLRVTDAHTGTSRPASTLSGGESFLAALSLALGLADVVQRYAGGIRLDTLFIDEGFGSLDPETLDLAFKAIADLQVQGRLVGIISHVPELKERIPVRLDVLPGKRGSMAQFVL